MKSDLFSPVHISPLHRSKNRIWLAPMTTQQSNPDGTFSADELRWLEQRAEGGFGALITACCTVSKNGQTYAGQIGAYSDIHLPGLAKFAELAGHHGSLSILQLVHGGLRASEPLTGETPIAPSAIEMGYSTSVMPLAMTTDDIEVLLQDFVSASLRAKTAGLSGIELHAANGYLFTQFLSTFTNRRQDEWGGSIDNRIRFLVRVIREIRNQAGNDFILGVRLRAEDHTSQKGFDIEDTLAVIDRIGELGISYVHIAAGSVSEIVQGAPGARSNIERIRSRLNPDVLLIGNGKIKTKGGAELALTLGADIVAIGKAAIGDPDWPTKIDDPHFEPSRFPMSEEQLLLRGVSPKFAAYLRNFNLVEP